MRRYGSELEFISRIDANGSKTSPVLEERSQIVQGESFKLNCLSITEGTYIASGFHSFVVKLKNPPPHQIKNK